MRKTVSEMSTLHRFGPLEAGAGDLKTVALVTMWVLASPCPLITAHFLNTILGSVAKTRTTSVIEGRSVQLHHYPMWSIFLVDLTPELALTTPNQSNVN